MSGESRPRAAQWFTGPRPTAASAGGYGGCLMPPMSGVLLLLNARQWFGGSRPVNGLSGPWVSVIPWGLREDGDVDVGMGAGLQVTTGI